MSTLTLYKIEEKMEYRDLFVIILNLSRCLGVGKLFNEVALKSKSQLISQKTQAIYAMIYLCETLDGLIDKRIDFKYIVIPSIIYFLCTIIIMTAVHFLNSPIERVFDSFSIPLLILLNLGSLVLAGVYVCDGNEFFMIYCNCLNVFALVPQFYLVYKINDMRITVDFFIFAMIVYNVLTIFGIASINYLHGLKKEYHHFVFFVITILVLLICYLKLYPREIVNENRNENENQQDGLDEEEVEEEEEEVDAEGGMRMRNLRPNNNVDQEANV